MSEARELTVERIQKLAALPLREVLRYQEHPVKERITGPSGRSYRVHTHAFWDMAPYESDLNVRVDLSGRGRYWWQRYHGIDMRWADDDAPPEPPEPPEVVSAWTQNCACLTLLLIVLGLPLSLIYGIRRLLD